MSTGLQHLRTIGALGCALIGDPAYYSRHGFISEGHLHYPDVPDAVVQHMTFSGPRPSGTLIYTPAFAAKDCPSLRRGRAPRGRTSPQKAKGGETPALRLQPIWRPDQLGMSPTMPST
jgi:hypothetical protein